MFVSHCVKVLCFTKETTTTFVEHNWAASWQNQQSECAPSEDSDQPGHPPSLTRVFAVRMKKAWTISYPLSAQRRLWSDWADAQADLSLRRAHSHIVGFVTRRLIYVIKWHCVLSSLMSLPPLFVIHQHHVFLFAPFSLQLIIVTPQTYLNFGR